MKEYKTADIEKLGPPKEADVRKLVEKIKRAMQGRPPLVQGAALADIVAMYFAGHHPVVRDGFMEIWTELMQQMIKVKEKAITDAYGLTETWDKKPRQ